MIRPPLGSVVRVIMARQAEAEREKGAKIIDAEGESLAAAALGAASDIMMEHPLALQLPTGLPSSVTATNGTPAASGR